MTNFHRTKNNSVSYCISKLFLLHDGATEVLAEATVAKSSVFTSVVAVGFSTDTVIECFSAVHVRLDSGARVGVVDVVLIVVITSSSSYIGNDTVPYSRSNELLIADIAHEVEMRPHSNVGGSGAPVSGILHQGEDVDASTVEVLSEGCVKEISRSAEVLESSQVSGLKYLTDTDPESTSISPGQISTESKISFPIIVSFFDQYFIRAGTYSSITRHQVLEIFRGSDLDQIVKDQAAHGNRGQDRNKTEH